MIIRKVEQLDGARTGTTDRERRAKPRRGIRRRPRARVAQRSSLLQHQADVAPDGGYRDLDFDEAASRDGAYARLPAKPAQVDAVVVRVLLLGRDAGVVARIAHDRGRMRPRADVDGGRAADRDRWCALLHGEVRQPGAYGVRDGLTVLHACLQAGGFTDFAALHSVRLTRVVDGQSRTAMIDLLKVRQGKEPDPLLASGDRLEIPRRRF